MRARRDVLLALALLFAVVVAYLPALRAGFVWNDDTYLTENAVLDRPDALRLIWTEPQVQEQYYPLVFTSFWAEKKLWGLAPFGYHLNNVLLHVAAALLLALLLRRLKVPGAEFAAALFALHPVCVESVAWVAERKNTLSMVLALIAAHAFFAAHERRAAARERRGGKASRAAAPWYRSAGAMYLAALVAFTAALFAKTTASLLPAVLLVVAWWRGGRLKWGDVRPLVPFFAIGVALAWNTAHLERTLVGAAGNEWSLSWPGRVVLAGRVFWFYLGKFLWPADLAFIYTRWGIDPRAFGQWLAPLAALALVAALWALRNRLGRGPLVAALLFGGVLFPAMGFFNVYAMRYSYVADHFAYQAVAVAAAAFAAGVAGLVAHRGAAVRRAAVAAGAAACVALVAASFAQARVYRDEDTLWRDTLAKSPDCFMCHTNYGYSLVQRGRVAEAVDHFEASLRIKPDNVQALMNLARVEDGRGRLDAAIGRCTQVLAIDPTSTAAMVTLGSLYVRAGRIDEAIAQYEEALRHPSADDALAHNGLGAALMQRQRTDEAIAHFREAVRLDPENWRARANLDKALARVTPPR